MITSMYSLVLNGESISVSIASLVLHCRLFQTKPKLLSKPYRVESAVSSDSLRVFVGALGGAAVEISDANVRDLLQLCEEFKFTELAKIVGDWETEHGLTDAGIRRELDLVQARLEERLESQARTMLMLDEALHRGREAAMSDVEKLTVMEAEVSGLRSLLGETAVSVQKGTRDIDLVRTALAEQRLACGRDICAFEEEMGRVWEAMAEIRRSQRKQEDEWKAAIGDLHKKVNQEQREVSELKEMFGNLETKHEQLREAVARQGDELAETRRRNSELSGRMEQLEKENHRLCDSGEGLKAELARAEAGQQSAVAHLQEAIAAGGSKAKEDMMNIQGELAKLKQEIKRMKMTAKQFGPSVKKGNLRLSDSEQTDNKYDIPDGIIAHLTRECGGNVHDHHVVDVTSGSFEKETEGANPHSGAYDNLLRYAAKNAADLEAASYFYSALRRNREDIPHTRNNWI
jgi:predicted  nucleic acid-binding Zn-ribbon protein